MSNEAQAMNKTNETIEEIEEWCRQERRRDIEHCKRLLLKAIEGFGETCIEQAIAELESEKKLRIKI